MEFPEFSRLDLAVFLGGASSMGLEIVAGRLIAPTFGDSIYIWGSIIGVFMAALSLGYWIGGRTAADRASTTVLQRLFAVTAIYVAGIIMYGTQMVAWTATLPIPVRYASLPALLILFGPPVFLIGFISPYTAQLVRARSSGEASGRVYSLGTAGSIIGVFGTTFVLVPSMTTDGAFLVLGGLMVAAIMVLRPQLREAVLPVIAAGLLGAVAVSGVLTVGPADQPAAGAVDYQTQTPYQQLRVQDRGGIRTMYLNDQPQSALDLDDPNRHVFEYTRYFHVPLLMQNDTERVLFIGGGGFTGPKQFVSRYDVTVDAVEIDPAVIHAAKTYFNLTESERLNVHEQDGRTFLRQTEHTYDLIVMDAYQKDRVPFHLTTVEFMELARSHLDEDGAVLANVISKPRGEASAFYRSQYRTMNAVFPTVYAYHTNRLNVLQNIELIASKQPRISEEELQRRNAKQDIGIDLSRQIATYQYPVDTGDAILLEDDHAPVEELLRKHIGLEYTPQN